MFVIFSTITTQSSPTGTIVRNRFTSPHSLILSKFNCTAKTGEYHSPKDNLNSCNFTSVSPGECSIQASIACTEHTRVEAEAAVKKTPVVANLAPVNSKCSVHRSLVRLVDGTATAGRLELKDPITGVWGTVCANGFDVYATKAACRMLCFNEANLELAYPILYGYPLAESSIPIYISNTVCPANANSLFDCDLTKGSEAIEDCTHDIDVGVSCGPMDVTPEEIIYRPDLKCNRMTALLSYSKLKYPDVNKGTIQIYGGTPNGCLIQRIDGKEYFELIIPLEGCGENTSLINASAFTVSLKIIHHNVVADNAVIPTLPTITEILCVFSQDEISKTGNYIVVSESQQVTVNHKHKLSVRLQLFRDSGFTEKVEDYPALHRGTPVFVLLSTNGPLGMNKLMAEDCWVTPHSKHKSSVKKYLIVNRCIVESQVSVVLDSQKTFGFSFPAFYWKAVQKSKHKSKARIYVHCTTGLCDTKQSSCQRVCQNAGTRRRTNNNNHQQSQNKNVDRTWRDKVKRISPPKNSSWSKSFKSRFIKARSMTIKKDLTALDHSTKKVPG